VSLEIQPVFRVTLAKRTASSSCHGAKLLQGPGPGIYTCRQCGEHCDRVLSEPEEVTADG
jgi:hypothetical protein